MGGFARKKMFCDDAKTFPLLSSILFCSNLNRKSVLNKKNAKYISKMFINNIFIEKKGSKKTRYCRAPKGLFGTTNNAKYAST